MNRAAINAVLVQAYQDAGLDLPTAYEGFAFKPPSQKPWARLSYLPVIADQRLQTVDRVIGLLQIDLLYPAGKGTRAIHDTAKALTDYFLPRRRFEGEIAVSVDTRETTAVRHDEGWLVLSVTVRVRTALDRAEE